jgi:hypothetical protein
MTALNTIRNGKKSIGLIFAVSILAVTACDVFCSIDRSGALVIANPHAESHHVRSAGQQHHDHDKSHNQHRATKEIAEHSHPSSSTGQGDNCCKDITNQFYKSLFKGSDASVIKAPAQILIFMAVIDRNHDLSSIYTCTSFTSPLKVPTNLAGNHLRILISSFLI